MADADDPEIEFEVLSMSLRGAEYGLACLPWRGGYAVVVTYADGSEVKGLVEAHQAVAWFRAHGLRPQEAEDFVLHATVEWRRHYGDPERVQ